MPSDLHTISERIQADINQLRSNLDPEMIRHDVTPLLSSDTPGLNDMDADISGFNERISKGVTKVAGSIWFAYGLLVMASLWMSYNIYVKSHGGIPPDDPPDFSVMLLFSNFIQLLLPVFIMVSQRRAEIRDLLRADRDQLLTQIGRRDVLLMFTYLSEFAVAQRTVSLQQKESQEKLFSLEREQNRLSGDLLPGLLCLISEMSSTLRGRPCILDHTDHDVREYIMNRLRESKDGSHADDLGEG